MASYFFQGEAARIREDSVLEGQAVVADIASLVIAKEVTIGNDGGMPDDGEMAKLIPPDLPPFAGEVALRRPRNEQLVAA